MDVPEAEIAAEVQRALPAGGGLTRCTPLFKGHGHQSFIVQTRSGGPVLLKIALRREQAATLRSLCHTLELAARYGVAAPRLLYFSEGTDAFSGRPWLVQEFLDGIDGEDALVGMPPLQAAAFFRDFGRAVARLHSIDVGYFSEDFASAPREDSWRSIIESRLARLANRHVEAGLLSRQSIEAARAMILSAADMVTSDVRPAVVHRDLYLANTLVSAGHFRCLLDFEHARSADPLCDFVKLKMWVFDRIPGSNAEFCAGYGVNPLLTNDGRARHHVWLGLELLAGLPYWRQTRQSAMLADYEARFSRWLSSGPASTAL